MTDKFTFYKQGKFLDHLEHIATEWMTEAVADFYDVEDIVELSFEQIQEVVEYADSDLCDPQAQLGLRNVIENWEIENEE